MQLENKNSENSLELTLCHILPVVEGLNKY